MSADMLFGAEQAGAEKPDGAESAGPPLTSLTTVFSFDPNTCVGVGASASGDELARVNVSGGWSDDLAKELTDRISAGAVAAFQTAMKGSVKPAHTSDVVAALRAAKAPVDLWGEVLGAVTTGDEQFVRGRVDVNSASAQVLACVPGIDEAAAGKIVEARARLDEPSRGKVTWPLKEGILKEEQFQSASDWITTRSLQWRVRVEARLEHGDSSGRAEEEEGPAGMVWEAVIDVSGERARVAYVRDVTYLPALAQRAREQEKSAATAPEVTADAPAPVEEDGGASLHMDKLQPSTQLKTDKLKASGQLKLEGMRASGSLDMNTDLDLGTGGRVRSEKPSAQAPEGGEIG